MKKVDPLGVTDLRIRGMWHIDNPHKIFKYLNAADPNAKFQLFCLMKTAKFNSFPAADRNSLKAIRAKEFSIKDVKIKNPNNPANLLDCTFITFSKK